MREHPVPLHQRDRRDGRAHAGQFAFAFGLADDGVEARPAPRSPSSWRRSGRPSLVSSRFDMRQRTDRNRRGRVAAGVASHAVADGHEMLTGERRVLIVAADRAHIRNGGGIQEQRLRSIGRQDRHLNSKVVAPMRTGTRGARTVGAEMRCWLTTVPFRAAEILDGPLAGRGIGVDPGMIGTRRTRHPAPRSSTPPVRA